MRIKRFEQLNEELGGDLLDIKTEYPKDTRNILDRLEDGFAISISKKDLKSFYKALSYYQWIDYTELDPEVIGSQLYFVLIGRKLYHTTQPHFGGQEFEVYIPSFN